MLLLDDDAVRKVNPQSICPTMLHLAYHSTLSDYLGELRKWDTLRHVGRIVDGSIKYSLTLPNLHRIERKIEI